MGADEIVSLETMREILDCLTLGQLMVVTLRWYGLTHEQVGVRLGISRMAVTYRLQAARQNVLRAMPELEREAEDRSMRTTRAVVDENECMQTGWRQSCQ